MAEKSLQSIKVTQIGKPSPLSSAKALLISPANGTDFDYAELNKELTTILEQLEQGELDIDEAVTAYARGLDIIAILESRLKTAENRITELRETAGRTEDTV